VTTIRSQPGNHPQKRFITERQWLRIEIGAAQDSDAEELDRDTGELRAELLELDIDDVQSVEGEAAPAGAKGPASDAVGTLIVTLSDSAVLVALVGLLKSWVARDRRRTVMIQLGKDKIKADQVSAEEMTKIIESWMKKHGRE